MLFSDLYLTKVGRHIACKKTGEKNDKQGKIMPISCYRTEFNFLLLKKVLNHLKIFKAYILKCINYDLYFKLFCFNYIKLGKRTLIS